MPPALVLGYHVVMGRSHAGRGFSLFHSYGEWKKGGVNWKKGGSDLKEEGR